MFFPAPQAEFTPVHILFASGEGWLFKVIQRRFEFMKQISKFPLLIVAILYLLISGNLLSPSPFVLAGHLAWCMPFLKQRIFWSKRTTNAGSGTTKGMTSGSTTDAAGSPCATPLKWCWISIPSTSHYFKPSHNLLRCFWVLTIQSSSNNYPLYRFSHVQPGSTERCIQRHHSMMK